MKNRKNAESAPEPEETRKVVVTVEVPLKQLLRWDPQIMQDHLARHVYREVLEKLANGEVIR